MDYIREETEINRVRVVGGGPGYSLPPRRTRGQEKLPLSPKEVTPAP